MWNPFKKSPAEEESLKLSQIQAQLEEAKKDLDSTNAIIKDNLCTLKFQEETIKANRDTITSQEEILRGYGILEDIGYQFENTLLLSEAEQNLAEAEEQLAAITGSDNIIIYTRTYRIDGSERKGQKFQEAYGKNLLTGFNAYALSKEKGKPNYAYASELIKKSFEKFNKQGELVGIMLNPQFLTARLAVLHARCQVRQAKAEEAAKMREYKRKLREEAKVLAEIAKTKEKLEKERRYYEQTLGETYDETKRQEIQDKIAEIDKRVQDCDYREKNQRAGFLYVARSDAMPNYVKLGVTRRLTPLVRLQELSSASVPFPFKCYGLVFSDDVFELEAKVHQYFDQKRVNAFNRHKEFFNITPAEAVYVLTNKFNCKVTFVDENNMEEFENENDEKEK